MNTDVLMISHADEPKITLMNVQTMQAIRTFDLPGRIAVLGASSDRRYGFAIHRDDDCVTVINATEGIVKAICSTAKQPTHFHAHMGHSLIFNDGSGSVMLFEDSKIPRHTVFDVTAPDHGSALLIEDWLLVGYLRRGCVEVYQYPAGEHAQTFEACIALHGAAQVSNHALFGCGDGVLLLTLEGGAFQSVKVPNPADAPPRTRVGRFATHEGRGLGLGNFGEGLVVINPDAQTMRVISLPAYPLKFGFDAAGETAIVLTHDGLIRRLTLAGDEIAAEPVAAETSIPRGPDHKARPTFSQHEDHLYITDPEAQALIQVPVTHFAGRHSFDLDFAPGNILTLKG
ncbi:MAG: hypothetical protein AAF653_13595 [Chloroflexota bacterium]